MGEYRIKRVDTEDEEIVETLTELDRLTFPNDSRITFEQGYWWLCHWQDQPIGFAGVIQSTYHPTYCYFKRIGVLEPFRGHGLSKRLLRVLLARAKKHGWQTIITDTTENPPSANGIISCGFKIFEPTERWAFANSIYWRKALSHGVV